MTTTGCLAQDKLQIRFAEEDDVPLLLHFIRKLAAYEELSHEVVATEANLRSSLFGPRKYAEVLLAYLGEAPVGFALFFHSYSTFLAKPGIYLEDLFVIDEMRGRGFGRELLRYLAKLTVERGAGRLEWSVLDWNEPAIRFYKKLGARPMDQWTVYRITGEPLEALAREEQ